LGQKSHIFVSVTALTTLLVASLLGGLTAQNAENPLSFDQKAIEKWIHEKKAADPSNFNQPKCLRSEAFKERVGASCLAQQAIFFLNEVNRRRTIEQQALRRTLRVTDERRQKALTRADKAEETLSQAQISLQQVEALTQRLAELEAQVAVESEAAADLRSTNNLLIEAYKSLTDQLHQGLIDSLD